MIPVVITIPICALLPLMVVFGVLGGLALLVETFLYWFPPVFIIGMAIFAYNDPSDAGPAMIFILIVAALIALLFYGEHVQAKAKIERDRAEAERENAERAHEETWDRVNEKRAEWERIARAFGRNLRTAVVHCVVFAPRRSPKRSAARARPGTKARRASIELKRGGL